MDAGPVADAVEVTVVGAVVSVVSVVSVGPVTAAEAAEVVVAAGALPVVGAVAEEGVWSVMMACPRGGGRCPGTVSGSSVESVWGRPRAGAAVVPGR
ncbi:hypothetical protein CXF32_08670 [Corynebacterium bovis]|nr:hypothetical protein CXF32_08670 [Corynebacterium bovis]RRQ01747.1 hypothetical protein CXF39_07090 [Corynebacterium bovis]